MGPSMWSRSRDAFRSPKTSLPPSAWRCAPASSKRCHTNTAQCTHARMCPHAHTCTITHAHCILRRERVGLCEAEVHPDQGLDLRPHEPLTLSRHEGVPRLF